MQMTLTIEIPIEINDWPDKYSMEELSNDLETTFNEEIAKRYSFEVEMFRIGLIHCMRFAMLRCLGRIFRRTFGKEWLKELQRAQLQPWMSLETIGKVTLNENVDS